MEKNQKNPKPAKSNTELLIRIDERLRILEERMARLEMAINNKDLWIRPEPYSPFEPFSGYDVWCGTSMYRDPFKEFEPDSRTESDP